MSDEIDGRVYLRAFETEDLELINEWRNDEDIFALTSGNKYFISKSLDEKWLKDKMVNNQSIDCAWHAALGRCPLGQCVS
jgi:RimJ/RimL family protein N-acetyltransferase